MTYTSTTGRFTVPIDGIYEISCTVYHNEDSTTFRIGGNINNTNIPKSWWLTVLVTVNTLDDCNLQQLN